MAKRATEGALGELHEMFAKVLSEKLKTGDCSSSELNVIRQFLKDNNIECIGEQSDTINDILENLPAFEENKPIYEQGDRLLH